jgi:NTP pyrophosphatase (non-canonical NTP hydrolase)
MTVDLTGIEDGVAAYQSATHYTRTPSTGKYPILYPALGLAEEAGEVLGKIKKMVRDDNDVLTDERRELIKGELGDVLWYLAQLAADCGLNLGEVASFNIRKTYDRKDRGVIHGNGDHR